MKFKVWDKKSEKYLKDNDYFLDHEHCIYELHNVDEDGLRYVFGLKALRGQDNLEIHFEESEESENDKHFDNKLKSLNDSYETLISGYKHLCEIKEATIAKLNIENISLKEQLNVINNPYFRYSETKD